MAPDAHLRDEASERPAALLCFERDPKGGHRLLLIEAVMPAAEVTDVAPDNPLR